MASAFFDQSMNCKIKNSEFVSGEKLYFYKLLVQIIQKGVDLLSVEIVTLHVSVSLQLTMIKYLRKIYGFVRHCIIANSRNLMRHKHKYDMLHCWM